MAERALVSQQQKLAKSLLQPVSWNVSERPKELQRRSPS
jgi:hypothetical protein